MKKIIYISTLLVLFFLVVSCEKDFREIDSNVISNNNFETKKIVLDLEIEPYKVDVRADNIVLGRLGEYWLGVYNKVGFEKLEASIITQLNLPTTAAASITDKVDTLHTIDAVYLKIPYTAVNIRATTDDKPKFRIDSILGNTTVPCNIKVFKNETFLNTLNPSDPSKSNEFLSNADYTTGELLSKEMSGFDFQPNPNDTVIVFERKDSNGTVYTSDDTDIKIVNGEDVIQTPFIAIPLDKAKIKSLIWDEIISGKLVSQDVFNNELRGLIIEATGDDGAAVPLSLSTASLDIYYTRTILKDGAVEEKTPLTLPFLFSGVVNSRYKKGTGSTIGGSTSNVGIQGTSGSAAKIKILNDIQLQDLRSKNVLINDASLVFNIDASTDTTNLPRRLTIYKENDGFSTTTFPSLYEPGHIKDSYTETIFFGGQLELNNNKPEKYTLRITDHVSDVISDDTNNSDLILKAFNTPTDLSVDPTTRQIDTIVKKYNWNPRGISLLNNSTLNGEKRAKLILSYTEEK